jgi:hypothetical protein
MATWEWTTRLSSVTARKSRERASTTIPHPDQPTPNSFTDTFRSPWPGFCGIRCGARSACRLIPGSLPTALPEERWEDVRLFEIKYDLKYMVMPNSYHFPGQLLRLVFL